MGVNRRQVLRKSLGLTTLGIPLLGAPTACRTASACEPLPPAANDRPIRAQAEKRGLLFGAAANRPALEQDGRYAEALAAECSMITPENSMKWERLRPAPDRFDFENADWLMAFAGEHGLQVHGHTLVWDKQLPDWFETHVEANNAEAVLIDHIETVAGHYAGRLRSWDVVNEAIDPDAGRGDGLRLSPWLEHLGPDYIDLAFHTAAEADPEALLVYNDFGVEYEGDWFEPRRDSMLDLLTGMVARGVPIDAVGIQAHLSGDKPTDFGRFARFLSDVAELGLDLMITELDVRDHKLPADVGERDCRVAAVYQAFLDVVLDQPRLRSIAVWGLSDRFSWLSAYEPRDDGLPVRPLPLDQDMQRKPAWTAISRALARP